MVCREQGASDLRWDANRPEVVQPHEQALAECVYQSLNNRGAVKIRGAG